MVRTKVESVNKTILRGYDTYEHLLSALHEANAPLQREGFIGFMANDFYNNDDFCALIILIGEHLGEYDETKTNDVLLHIFEEIFEDYKKSAA